MNSLSYSIFRFVRVAHEAALAYGWRFCSETRGRGGNTHGRLVVIYRTRNHIKKPGRARFFAADPKQSQLILSHSPKQRIRSSGSEASPERISARHRQVKDASVDSTPLQFAVKLARLWQDRPVVYRF
jgi:hypothetical protein